jgi:hypothetical protein
MKFAIFSEVTHPQFGRGIVRAYNSLTDGYTVLFGQTIQFVRTVKENTLSKPAYKSGPQQYGLHQFL